MPQAATAKSFRNSCTEHFTESVIREMTRQAIIHNAVNLAQGFPDFPAPIDIKQAAIDSINADYNQYPITWGVKPFREAICRKYKRTYGMDVDPATQVTVTCGATEAMIASLLAVTNPGDEIVVFEPFYENYHPDALLCGAERKLVTLYAPDWRFDPDELRRAFSPKTKAVIITTPNNPTGKVFSREELTQIAELCQEFDTLAITDEIYEHITYDGRHHIPIATLPGMRDRTITINSMSKTFSVTGWRVGWAIAAPELTNTIRKVHDFLTVGAATPMQHAGIMALDLPDSYFNGLGTEYDSRRGMIISLLEKAGFKCYTPGGAYYVMCDISAFGAKNDTEFAMDLVKRVGVAGVPGSSFYLRKELGAQQIRFCFCKKFETLEAAGERLMRI